MSVGGVKIQTVFIRNFNYNFYNLSGQITVSGPHANDFPILRPEDTQLGWGESSVFQIWFKPTAAGIRTATVKLVLNGEDYTSAVSGEGTGPVTLVLPEIGQKLGPKVSMRKLRTGENTFVMDIKATLELANSSTFASSAGKVEVYYSYDEYLDPAGEKKVLELAFKALPAAANGKQIIKKLKLKPNPTGSSGNYFIRVIPDNNSDSNWANNQVRLPFQFF